MSSSLVESLISSPEPVGQHKYHPGSSVLSRAGRFSSYTLLAVCSTSSLCLPIMHLCCSAAEPHKPDPPLRTFIKQLRVDKSNCNQSESRDLRPCVLPLLSERLKALTRYGLKIFSTPGSIQYLRFGPDIPMPFCFEKLL